MKPIQAVIFDLGNVLIRVDELRFATRLAAHATATPATLAEFFHRSPAVVAYSTGKSSAREFFEAVVCATGWTGTFEEFADIWCDIFSPIQPTLTLAMDLKGRLPRVMLSNTNALHMEYVFQKFPVVRDFDGHVLSHEVGMLKPAAEIYEWTLRRYGFKAEQTVFVDDLAANCAGARAVGMPAIQCVSPEQLRRELTKLGVLTI